MMYHHRIHQSVSSSARGALKFWLTFKNSCPESGAMVYPSLDLYNTSILKVSPQIFNSEEKTQEFTFSSFDTKQDLITRLDWVYEYLELDTETPTKDGKHRGVVNIPKSLWPYKDVLFEVRLGNFFMAEKIIEEGNTVQLLVTAQPHLDSDAIMQMSKEELVEQYGKELDGNLDDVEVWQARDILEYDYYAASKGGLGENHEQPRLFN